MPDVDMVVIGGGAIGRSVALACSRKRRAEIVVLERSAHEDPRGQSTRNSGVIHAGLLYNKSVRPLKARLCVEGNRMLYEFCREHGVHHAQTGKLIVATNEVEEGALDALLEIARDNGVPGVALIDAAQVTALEPNVYATKALHVPTSGVIDAAGLMHALKARCRAHSLRGAEVVAIEPGGHGFAVIVRRGAEIERFTAKHVINAAGLYADDVARMIDADCPYKVLPVRGEAARFSRTRRPELAMRGHNIYPTPHGVYLDSGQRANVPYAQLAALLAAGTVRDTVGVHISPTLDENGELDATVLVGPAITTGVTKEDYGRDLRGPEHYYERVKPFFPGLQLEDLQLYQAGIQARLPDHLDWIIEPDARHPRFINLIGIDSPGLTSALAIAKYVTEEML